MALLTMTPTIVAAVQACHDLEVILPDNAEEPSLADPAVGNPISHIQLIAISKQLRKQRKKLPSHSSHLDSLLRGSKIYIEVPPPKAEPTSEYKTLMARLRREEEAREYERMINPPPPTETFEQRFPGSGGAKLFTPSQADIDEDDDMTYADINRQMTLIINILVSIVACSVAIWLAARHWNTPARLGLSMGGSSMIGVAEVVVYAGYLRRVKEARKRGQKQVETKEITRTWVIGGEGQELGATEPLPVGSKSTSEDNVRKRRAG